MINVWNQDHASGSILFDEKIRALTGITNPKVKNNAFESHKDDATGRFFSDWLVGQLWPVHTISQSLE